jgi:hypothetical protein
MNIELTHLQALVLRNYLITKIASDVVNGEKVNPDLWDTHDIIAKAISEKVGA